MNKKQISYFVIALLIFLTSFSVGAYDKDKEIPLNLYQVYLDGEDLGYINSEDNLFDYINEQESELKDKYGVSEIYMPKGLEIIEKVTYDSEIFSIEGMYKKIRDKKAFTINGFIVNVTSSKGDYELFLLDEEIFKPAVNLTLNNFISEDDYEKYLEEFDTELTELGKKIENVYLDNSFTITAAQISIDELIFTNKSQLAKYLLYGTLENQKTYEVKKSETISTLAYNQGLSNEEFLIANQDIKSINSLVYPGQTVNVGIIDPQLEVVVSEFSVIEKKRNYETTIIYDKNLIKGFDYVKTTGQDGLDKISQRITYLNGDEIEAEIITTNPLIATINKVLVVGKKEVPSVGDLSKWFWPTKKPYVITSPFGPRWGSFHHAIDIAGTGYGSPIYAAANGTVERVGFSYTGGNFMYINHNNGYYTYYCHLAAVPLVKVGQVVSAGTNIGKMGNTGYNILTGVRVGTHLHFGIWKGRPYGSGSQSYNPLSFY